jgi:hypothetical protein
MYYDVVEVRNMNAPYNTVPYLSVWYCTVHYCTVMYNNVMYRNIIVVYRHVICKDRNLY